MTLTRLFAPGRIGTLELRNRIVLCPMGLNLGNVDGSVSDDEVGFYEARARGGAGLLIMGTAGVAHPSGLGHPRMPAVSDDRHLSGLRLLTSTVQRHGARIAAQLNHHGVNSHNDVEAGRPRLVPFVPPPPAPDAVMSMVTLDEVARMTEPFRAPGADAGYRVADEDDIAWVIERHAEAADRCRRAGFDGVEIHVGHNYVINEFLSPRNRRLDRWGGDFENRSRLLVEVLAAVRARVGGDYPMWVRINAFERHYETNQTFEEQLRLIDLAAAGGCDAIHLTAYANPDSVRAAPDSYMPHVVGTLAEHAAAVRARVGVPVITFGRFEPDEADAVLAEGKADFVGFGRKLLADPDLPNKLAAGHPAEVRPCIYQQRCTGNIYLRTASACAVNAHMGRERRLALIPTTAPRRVLVVGGGPAGMETSRLLAVRGHHVVLREARVRLGGLLVAASIADPLLAPYLTWLVAELERTGVVVELGRPFDHTSLEGGVDAAFDDIVLATGGLAVPVGAHGDVGRVRTLRSAADDLLWEPTDAEPSAEPSVVVLGDDKAALSLAAFHLRSGRRVTVVGPTHVFGVDLPIPARFRLIDEITSAGVRLLGGATVASVGARTVGVLVDDIVEHLAADLVISTARVAPPERPPDETPPGTPRLHLVGDRDAVGSLSEVTEGALRVARSIG